MNDKYKQWGVFLLAVVVFLINQLPFLEDMRPVMYDEAWYGNTAFHFAHGGGFINTIVGKGGNANFLLSLFTSGSLLLFGYNLFAIRIVAVFCGVLTMLIFVFVMRQLRLDWKPMAFVFLFFVSVPFYNTVFRFGRPECASLMFVAGGLLFYLRYRMDETWGNMVGVSLFVLAAGCSHPFSLFLFFLLGAALFLQTFTKKKTKTLCHLVVLLMAAVVCIIVIILISKNYSVGGGSEGVFMRFSPRDAKQAIPLYFKEAFFSKVAFYVVPLLLVLFYEAYYDKDNRALAVAALAHFLVFPILFSTDLMMVGLGLDYVVLTATVLLAPFIGRMLEQRRRCMVIGFVIYCVGCMGISYYYNYGVKYEKANSVLTQELQSVVPKGARVFGPLRQWPMLMQTDYQSEHTVLPIERVEAYDFFILNTQDTAFYSTYKTFLPIDESKLQLVYEKSTKQYGIVQAYKVK